MLQLEHFLTAKEEEEIVLAIRQAERNTSGEIRVHIEKTSQKKHYDRAVEVFRLLKMFNTKHQNAVLIYIAVHDHKFVVFGDKGINKAVSNCFWNSIRDIMQQHFKHQNYKQGLVDGILKIGEELKNHFPCDDNFNELPNIISKG